MKIITIHLNKGGGGKSTTAYNLADYFVTEKGQRVLLIDGDHSCNLSHSFEVSSSHTLYDVMTTGEADIVSVTEQLSLICGDVRLTDARLDLMNRNNQYLQLFMWFSKYYEALDSQFDVVIIDTHNDESLLTANLIAVSDMVVGVTDPSTNGYRAWLGLKTFIEKIQSEAIEVVSRQSYVKTKPYLLANKINVVGQRLTETSAQFLDVVRQENTFVGGVRKKELLARSLVYNQPIFSLWKSMTPKEKEKQASFYQDIRATYQTIYTELMKEAIYE
ncbi:ParA family protein [Streptococcus dysgalactiae]|uniref:AAA family ATPase n=1 Tax=Streptococcus dysgalactiae subsp. equisimilis TaxID=119602 RepID=A0AB38Y1V2_STREQ|nr:AAA family ATPase [Streptococcus dysgalactiae]HEN6156966.1 ParA family protein [Streptococcus agalactiae]HER1343151.1 ParA family protein [Streptococcus pyogenes]MCY7206061.1 AAA family ATPase [Streptococcus dysgalactiae]OBY98016.1 cobalamin biosynthesis protein CobQ [Streptococcus dysgalactiae subsp. equisimilis]OCX08428.1 cobalamin biosynthesis protein CobQ [Streptococcus dysgalactiae subsp. equisimilis AKSDE4288]